MVRIDTRRQFLRATGVGLLGTLAGCPAEQFAENGEPAEPSTPTIAPGIEAGSEGVPTFQYDSHNTGVATGATVPEEEPTERWRIEDARGLTHHPLVVGDALFGRSSLGAVVEAYDLRERIAIWQHSTEGLPAFADSTLVVATEGDEGEDHTVAGLSVRSGEPSWEQTIPDEPTMEAITVADGTAYVGAKGATLHALDVASGEQLWTYEVAEAREFRSPPAVADGTVFVGGYAGRRANRGHAIDAESGDRLWETDQLSGNTVAAPTVVDDTVVFGTNGLTALDVESGDLVWENREPQSFGSPALADGTLYLGGEDDIWAVDADNGDKVWTVSHGGRVTENTVVADGVVLAPTEETLYAVGTGGETLWTKAAAEGEWATPVVAGDTIYAADDEALYAFGGESTET